MRSATLFASPRRRAGVLTCGAILVAGGCGSPTSPPTSNEAKDSQPPASSPSATVPAPAASDRTDERYEGPPFDLAVHGLGGTGAERIDLAVTVLTGGWSLTIDEPRSGIDGRIKRVFATLEGPGADEMVTQALETKRSSITLDGVADRVELWVRVLRRGDANNPLPFRLAASSE